MSMYGLAFGRNADANALMDLLYERQRFDVTSKWKHGPIRERSEGET